MRDTQERTVLTVGRLGEAWVVEMDGEVFGRSLDKEVCKASANKRARQMQDAGRACLVRISGEAGFFSAH
ncbi:MAG TPA: hypothetical protein VG227_01695 [Caulobacteraceae bacterium]|jgi:hypothetical protein|nr:hypothetical protein [Caulobacteraceae bacterium]